MGILCLVLGLAPLSDSYGTGYGPADYDNHRSVLSPLASPGYISSLPATQLGHLSSLPSLPQPLSPSPQSDYLSPACSEHYHAQFPVCSNSRSYQNCTVFLDNMYTIEYKEECGRRYDKICYGPENTDCKAVVDPGCYSVPTHSPVQVSREVCYQPSTGVRCDNTGYPREFSNNLRCN